MHLYVYINGSIKKPDVACGNVNTGREKTVICLPFSLTHAFNKLEVSQYTQNMMCLEGVCTSWKTEEYIDQKLWVSIVS